MLSLQYHIEEWKDSQWKLQEHSNWQRLEEGFAVDNEYEQECEFPLQEEQDN